MSVLFGDLLSQSYNITFSMFLYLVIWRVLFFLDTVNSPNCRHFGTQASVLCSESVLYSGVRIIPSPICVVITVIMLFDTEASGDIVFQRLPCLLNIWTLEIQDSS